SNGGAVLSGTLEPSSVTVSNGSTAYTFSGAGNIGGATSLLKSGTGTLTISNSNSYSGGTVISSGRIVLTNSNALSTTGTASLGDANTGTNDLGLLLGVSSSGSGSGVTFSRPVIVNNQGSGTVTIGRTGTGN